MLRLYGTRFAGHLSHALGQVADIRMPAALLRPVIRAYSIAFRIEMDDVLEPEGGFECFGDFFVRRLRPDVRPICRDRDALLSPSDGEVVDRGEISAGPDTALQIKGSSYDVDQLLAGAVDEGEFAGGGYLVVYLHPRDYHRVHCPLDGELAAVCHIPGKHFPVAAWSERRVRGVYGKNERMAYVLRPKGGGTVALVMVAAFGVSNIETPFAPLGGGDNGRSNKRCFDPQIRLSRGDDLGAFRLGSTVVLLWTPGAVEIDPDQVRDRVQVGARIGRLCAAADDRASMERE